MELNFAITCEDAFVDQSNRLSIIKTFNEIITDNLPAVHSKLAIVTNYSLTEKERNKKHIQLIKIFNPLNQQIVELETQTKKEKQRENMQFIGFFHNIPLEKDGIYKIEIYLDGKLQEKKLSLKVIKNN
jgi:hypothetical protein